MSIAAKPPAMPRIRRWEEADMVISFDVVMLIGGFGPQCVQKADNQRHRIIST
jgi:hypothetical protein